MHSRDHNEKKKNFRAVNKQLLISSDQRKRKLGKDIMYVTEYGAAT